MGDWYLKMDLDKLVTRALCHDPRAMSALRIRRPDLADDFFGPLPRRRECQRCGKDLAVKN